ncbi:MAG: M48 family metallopeptidase [Gammaproteobacteria bacterium]|nr:M48 family metallopeptidase [Gammaproteobacteria bacterium]
MVDQEIIVEGRSLSYRVNFNRRRKTRSLIRILPDGGVLVDVPASVSLLQIRRWVVERAEWLLQRRDEIEEGTGFVRPLSYLEDEEHLFLGKRYRLRPFNSRYHRHPQGISAQSLYIHAGNTNPDSVKHRLWGWYREQARAVFQQRLADLSKTVPWVDFVPELKLRKMRRRWGSCNSRVVTLNTHLIKAPVEFIDYVILHELCHLRELNHSCRFYRLMDHVLPEWRKVKQRLDERADFISNE